MRKVRSVARAPAEYRYRITGLHGVPSPSLPDQHIGWKAFKFPVDYVAGVVLHVQIIMNVRILPVHLGDNAGDRDRFRVVVFRPKRMVRECRSRNQECESGGQEVSSHKRPRAHYISPPRSPNTCSALVWYRFFLTASLMGRWSVTFTSSGTNW